MLDQNFIPPNFKISTALMHTPKFVEQPDLPRYFTANIKYKDLSNKDYAESYTLDLAKYIYPEKTVEFTDNFHLMEIAKHLKEINSTIKSKE